MSQAPGELRRQLEFLINGFSFYGRKEQLREDDRLVRERAARSLTEAAGLLREAEQAFRRQHVPTPTREHPFPEPAVMAQLEGIQRLVRQVEDVEARLRAQPYPHTDRTWARLRTETGVLELVLERDLLLVRAADAVREAAVAAAAGASDDAALAPPRQALSACEEALRQRATDLTLPM